MHTTHGRALAFATGLKMVRPWMKILVIMGDGDALAIGGNHFIHAARRNIGLTAIVINNQIYGMTGGQYSPTTPTDALATTAPYGHIEQPFPITELAQAAGAAYVARSTIYHVRELQRYIAQAISKDGFSVVEAVSYCHTTFGRQNKLGRATDMMHHIQEHSVTLATASEMGEDERKQVIVRGVLVDRDIPEYTRLYDETIAKAQAEPRHQNGRHQNGRHQVVRQAESDSSAVRPKDTTEPSESTEGITTPKPASLPAPTELLQQSSRTSQGPGKVTS
jgi:2-oxoglutarate ferredoxin oxidoreductase subunit beta